MKQHLMWQDAECPGSGIKRALQGGTVFLRKEIQPQSIVGSYILRQYTLSSVVTRDGTKKKKGNK